MSVKVLKAPSGEGILKRVLQENILPKAKEALQIKRLSWHKEFIDVDLVPIITFTLARSVPFWSFLSYIWPLRKFVEISISLGGVTCHIYDRRLHQIVQGELIRFSREDPCNLKIVEHY